MKIAVYKDSSGLRDVSLLDADPVEPGEGEIQVRIRASTLNYHDYLVAAGVLKTAPTRIPLSDGAGEVTAVGAGVSGFEVGDRVLGTFFPDWLDGRPTPRATANMRGDHVDGFASEYVTYQSTSFTRAPKRLSDSESASLACAGLTAWRALFVEGAILPGDTVLVQGTGGVSIFALQFARMAGAKVIALSSSEAKLERLTTLGADHVINYREVTDWGRAVREATDGNGVDHVVEVTCSDLQQSLQAMATGAGLYLIGSLGKQGAGLMPGATIRGNQRIVGLTVGSRRDQERMVAAVEANGLEPVMDRRFELGDLRAAFEHQAAGAHFGKIAISI